ncbi:MAG TPA: DUF4242 domain-containing protein [Polyangiales bacterium]|nr:DUF4242 domain-containing protein [Polyangiales bacterium]
MNRYIIERNIPGAGKLSQQELSAIAGKTLAVLQELGPDVQWTQSFVTGDKIYCIYIAKNAELVREHARRGGFPADVVNEVRTVIDPTTARDR